MSAIGTMRLIGEAHLTAILFCAGTAWGQLTFESPPIDYENAPTTDRIVRLQAAIDRGDVTLEHDDAHGYLRSVLEQLNIPVSSQMLVFSKTSFQQRRISPKRASGPVLQ